MSSQSPAANEEASTEVKEEPPTNNEDDVITAASPPLEVDVWPTKADSEIMNGIVKRLTEYKPPGYMKLLSIRRMLLRETNSFQFRCGTSLPFPTHDFQEIVTRLLRGHQGTASVQYYQGM